MSSIAPYIHYGSLASIAFLTSLGGSIGQGITSTYAIAAINQQPSVKTEITRNNVLALALIETAAILGFLLAILLTYSKNESFYGTVAEIALALALGIPGLVVGIVSSFPAKGALIATARQPFLAKQISNGMILMQSLLQTPLIFGFIIALLIRNQLSSIHDSVNVWRVIASGLCIALAAVGPAIGSALMTYAACDAFGRNSAAYNKIFSFTIINQAIIETPIILASVISFWLLQLNPGSDTLQAAKYIAAACCMGIGTWGVGINSGRTVATTIKEIAKNPDNYALLSRTSMIALGLIDTSAIYVFIIALFLIVL